MKILFVQNKPALAAALQLTMLRQGFEVIFCKSAFEAIDNIIRYDPMLVVIDIMTPSLGLDFVKKIKSYNLPVIVMSGFGHEEQLQKAFEVGADDYINFPISMNELALRSSIIALKAKAQA